LKNKGVLEVLECLYFIFGLWYTASMNTSTKINKEMRQMVTSTVRQVFLSEFTKFRALILPYISSEEQHDIETRYGKKPSRKAVQSLSFDI